MRAVRTTGDGGVAVVDTEARAPEGALDPVRVRVRSAGICGSDLRLLRWGVPVTMGHEFAGVLDDGTAVAVQPIVPCGECDLCADARGHLCRVLARQMYGVSVDGGLADEVIVDRRCLVPLPAGVSPTVAALTEPVAVAVHAAHAAGLDDDRAADRVLVIGGGSIGLVTVTVARHFGAEVDLVARHPRQCEAGERLGARLTLAPEYDLVLDCAGTQSSLDDAIGRIRPGGTIVVPGTFWDPVQLGIAAFSKEVHIVMSSMYDHHHGVREFDEAAAVLAAHPELAETVVTHRFGLDDAAQAFRVAADRASGAIKVLVEP